MYMLTLYIVYNIYNIYIYYINIYTCVCLHFTSFLCEAKVKSKEYIIIIPICDKLELVFVMQEAHF